MYDYYYYYYYYYKTVYSAQIGNLLLAVTLTTGLAYRSLFCNGQQAKHLLGQHLCVPWAVSRWLLWTHNSDNPLCLSHNFSSTCSQKHKQGQLPQTAFIVECVNIIFTSSFITMQQLVAASHTVCLHVEGPNNLGGCWGPTPTDGGVLDALESRNTLLPHMYYHAKFCCSRSNLVDTDMGVPKIWEMLGLTPSGWGCGWPIGNMMLLYVLPHKFSHFRSNRLGVDRAPNKRGMLRPHLGHPLRKGAWLTAINMLHSNVCYRTKSVIN